MGCFFCLSNAKAKNIKKAENAQSNCGQFSLRELTAATGNFSEANVLGEGGFGKVYKGHLSFARIVAIKVLFRGGLQGSKEFVNEVEMLRLLKHPNLVKLIGYCAEGDQKLLVYEFMSGGSLADYLFGASANKETLDWETRIDIALGVAKGLQYLHCTDPPIIHRDIKSSNILLGNGFQPKLADFGLAKFGPSGDRTHVSTRVMGTYGYCAPDYAASGKLNVKSDIYCLGVVLLELITGRSALDNSKPLEERDLVTWARLFLRGKKMALQLIDPSLKGCFTKRQASRLLIIAEKCLHENPNSRPEIGHVVDALKYLQASRSHKADD